MKNSRFPNSVNHPTTSVNFTNNTNEHSPNDSQGRFYSHAVANSSDSYGIHYTGQTHRQSQNRFTHSHRDDSDGQIFDRHTSYKNHGGPGVHMQYSTTPQNYCSINSLQQGMQSWPMIGFVIAKEDPKIIKVQKESDSNRCVISFVLRDSPFDTIGLSLWGSPEKVQTTSKVFSIGDIIQVTGLNVKDKQPADQSYKPWTSSPYHIVLNDNHSNINLYDGPQVDDIMRLAHMPVQTPGPVYTLSDIVNNITNLSYNTVSFIASVRSVGPSKKFTDKKSGRQRHLREIKLFDQRTQLLHLTLWSNELITLSQYWQVNQTVLSVTDVTVKYDQYKKGVVASTSAKTIITVNPDTREAASLYKFAQTVTWPDEEGEDVSPALQSIDISTVKAEYNVYDYLKLSSNMSPDSAEYGIIYGFLSSFDIDGALSNVVSGKCCECGKRLTSVVTGRCSNYDCVSSDIMDFTDDNIFYNIKLDISDHSATITNCRLSTDIAPEILQYKPVEFIQLSNQVKTTLKWNYLFERCKFIVKAYRVADFPVRYIVLSLKKIGCREHLEHMR